MLVPGRLDTEPHATHKSFLDFPCLPSPTPSSQAFCVIPLGALAPDTGCYLLPPELFPPQPQCLPSQSYCFLESSVDLHPQIG